MKFNVYVNGTLGWYDGTKAILGQFGIWTGNEGWEAQADALTYEHLYDAVREYARVCKVIVEIRDGDYATPRVFARFDTDGSFMPLNYYVYTTYEQDTDGRLCYVVTLTDHYTTHDRPLSQYQHEIAGPLTREAADAEVNGRVCALSFYGARSVTRQIFDFIKPPPMQLHYEDEAEEEIEGEELEAAFQSALARSTDWELWDTGSAPETGLRCTRCGHEETFGDRESAMMALSGQIVCEHCDREIGVVSREEETRQVNAGTL